MEQQRLSEDDRLLESGSSFKLKLEIQRELLEFVIVYLEQCLQGHSEGVDVMTVRQNPYAIFIIEELSEKYAVWFEDLCSETGVDGKVRRPMTEGEFREFYQGEPRRVLAEVIAHLDYESVDEYLRELQEWFKVRPASDGVEETGLQSILRVPIQARLTRQMIDDLIREDIPKSA